MTDMKSKSSRNFDNWNVTIMHLCNSPSMSQWFYQHYFLIINYWLLCTSGFIVHNQISTKIISSCDISCTNGALHQACGHMWSTYSHRLLMKWSSFHTQIDSFNCLALQWLSLSKHFSIWPVEDVTLLCHMICYCLFPLSNPSNLRLWTFCCW